MDNLTQFITKDEDTYRLFIPMERVFDYFTIDEMAQLGNGQVAPVVDKLKDEISIENYVPKLIEDGIEMEWEITRINPDMEKYFKPMPGPIPDLFEIPITALQKALRTDEYSVLITKESNREFKARQNIAGIYGRYIDMEEITSRVSQFVDVNIKFSHIENRNIIFLVAK